MPWSLPLSAGMLLGVGAAARDAGWLLFVLALATSLLAAWSRGRRGLALAVLIGLAAGALRYTAWSHRLDSVTTFLGEERVFEGVSDGRLLRLDGNPRVTVEAVKAGTLPAGRVRVRGVLVRAAGSRNPGGFDRASYLRRRGIAAQISVLEVLSVRPRPPLVERFRRGARAGLPPARAALMEAMTLGLRDELGDVRDSFAASGLAHVLAVSGLHLAVLVAALARLSAPLGRRRYPLLMAAAVAYVLLVGPSPSLVRACCMALAGLTCLALGYPRIEPWPVLALAACVGLLVAPASAFDLSFQLSYLAVAGMVGFTLPFARLLSGGARLPRPRRPQSFDPRASISAALAASMAAQLPTLSLVASTFHGLPLAAPILNLVAVPLAAILVPLGFCASVAGLAWLPVSVLLNQVVSPIAGFMLRLARVGAELPRLPWGEVSVHGHVCFFAAVVAIALVANGRLRPWRGAAVVLVAVLLSVAVPPAHHAPEVVFLDVGQGDATVVRLPGGVEILVDGGGTPFSDFDVGEAIVVPALRALAVGKLEVVVATHPDADHVEGLLAVLREFDVGTLVLGTVWPGNPLDERIRALASQRGVVVHEARRGERWVFGRGGRQAVFEVLNPPARSYGSTNADSVAFVLRYGGATQVLFLGDLPGDVEARLAVPAVPVLKVAHHGSARSTSVALLRAAHPRLAVVSVGRNGYGHPSPEVLERLRAAGVSTLTTQAHGAVRLPLSPRGPGPPSSYVP